MPSDAKRLLVCGSRNWTDEDKITRVLSNWWVNHDVTFIHGDAPGADRIAAKVARSFGWEVRAFPADWQTHGKRAGILRNLRMLDERPDLVVAFTNGSRGTQHTIDEARRRGIPVVVYGSEVRDAA